MLDVNEPTTHHYAENRFPQSLSLYLSPRLISPIAALCRQHSLPLLSRDRHFDLVAGTKRIGW